MIRIMAHATTFGRLRGEIMLDHADLGLIVDALCGAGTPAALLGVSFALLGVGFFGGFAHCGPMCGPFIVMQLGDPQRGSFALRRLGSGLLPFYHLGRITTYVGIGAMAGGAGATIATLAPFHGALAVLLAFAALCFLLQGMTRATKFLPPAAASALGARIATVIARVAGPLLQPSPSPYAGARGFALGIVLGFLPCGFLYTAVIAAAATGGAAAGGLAMAAFGLGTIPALAAIGLIGNGAARRWRGIAAAIMPAIFLLNAATLGGIALHLSG